ncbi:Oidioi.mRNA.OKI2018_I69.chr2.g5813.t1.cds [Oikopleura dioica]|uniref:Oidioi.mRNA.OKI2018_I69.chr2.g5813.t1.cds n=1 Tax=Oikopleura dioica TaxID=34765 RepID=A0ABN7T750_OIKDI|nr:Oidioi.mRNA.OKI2018_I69.chr2.g5813.t1.cds [Oikopleura dioica]
MPTLIQRIVDPVVVPAPAHFDFPILEETEYKRSHQKEGYLYNYSGYGLDLTETKPVGRKRVRSKDTLLTFMQIAQQLMLIKSSETGEFLSISPRGKVKSLPLPTQGSLWKITKKASHSNFHSLTNKATNCVLSINRRGKVRCRKEKSSQKKKSTSFLPIATKRFGRRY